MRRSLVLPLKNPRHGVLSVCILLLETSEVTAPMTCHLLAKQLQNLTYNKIEILQTYTEKSRDQYNIQMPSTWA